MRKRVASSLAELGCLPALFPRRSDWKKNAPNFAGLLHRAFFTQERWVKKILSQSSFCMNKANITLGRRREISGMAKRKSRGSSPGGADAPPPKVPSGGTPATEAATPRPSKFAKAAKGPKGGGGSGG
jgi:hypothetical protein